MLAQPPVRLVLARRVRALAMPKINSQMRSEVSALVF
jgi:hypothetical protein